LIADVFFTGFAGGDRQKSQFRELDIFRLGENGMVAEAIALTSEPRVTRVRSAQFNYWTNRSIGGFVFCAIQ
jgi:hypothetical protein